jgi:hypothetical protein
VELFKKKKKFITRKLKNRENFLIGDERWLLYKN